MANTYVKIASATVGSGGAATIDFNSIAGSYTDLLVKASLRGSSGGGGTSAAWDNVKMRFNGTTTNYSYRALTNIDGAAGSISSASDSAVYSWIPFSGATASTFSNIEYYIPNYTAATAKSVSVDGVMENNATPIFNALVANLWNNTATITSIQLLPTTGNFAQYSTATLYGISKS